MEQVDNVDIKAEVIPQPEIKEEEKDTPEQINWRKYRESKENERRARQDAEKRAAEKEAEANALKAAMEALLDKKLASPQRDPDFEEPSDEQRIERLVNEMLDKKEKQREEMRHREQIAQLPVTLNKTFNDFDKVCSTENLDYLEFHYPEVASAYKDQNDSFDKWANIYKAIKRFVPNTDDKRDRNRAEQNFTKPQAMSIAGKTQTGDSPPVMLDEKRKADNWARMQRARKQV